VAGEILGGVWPFSIRMVSGWSYDMRPTLRGTLVVAFDIKVLATTRNARGRLGSVETKQRQVSPVPGHVVRSTACRLL
jgi:hypothetical protein